MFEFLKLLDVSLRFKPTAYSAHFVYLVKHTLNQFDEVQVKAFY